MATNTDEKYFVEFLRQEGIKYLIPENLPDIYTLAMNDGCIEEIYTAKTKKGRIYIHRMQFGYELILAATKSPFPYKTLNESEILGNVIIDLKVLLEMSRKAA